MQMRFIADRMLGRLARWLRILGIDTHYANDIDRATLIRIAKDEGRTILTRSRKFNELKHIPPYYLVQSGELDGQIAELILHFKGLNAAGKPFSRCIECNEKLEVAAKEDVKGLVPPAAFHSHQEFKRCRSCGRTYWAGTHVDRMRERLEPLKNSFYLSPKI
jgi:uncharacterized protein with PIN domain